MFWKFNSLSSSQIDALLDRAAGERAAKAAQAAQAASASAQAQAEAASASAQAEENETAKEDAASEPRPSQQGGGESDQAPPPTLEGGDQEQNDDDGQRTDEHSGGESPPLPAAAVSAIASAPKPVTLSEILEQDDVIQECKNQNKKLLDYLCLPEILLELICLITTEPPAEEDETVRFKLPHVAAELLTCEISQINEAISSDEGLLERLYSFLDKEPPLNPLLASFFSRAFGVLVTRKSEQNWYNYQYNCIQVFEFLKRKPLVRDLLRHIGTSSVSDLVLRLITCIEGPDVKQNLLSWLNENRLIESILGLLHPSLPRDCHDNASRLLIEILRVARDGQFVPANERCEDALLNTLEDPSTVELLLSIMFDETAPPEFSPVSSSESHSTSDPTSMAKSGSFKCESSLINGIVILLALLESRRQVNFNNAMSSAGYSAAMCNSNMNDDGTSSPEEEARQQRLLDATLKSILPRLKDFTDLLVNPPTKNPIKSTSGVLDPPLGATRLSVAKLINALLATNSPQVNEQLVENRTIDILLDMFFKYSLNNFLHNQVEQCLSHIFNWKCQSPQSSSNPEGQSAPNGSAQNATPPTAPISPKSDEEQEEEKMDQENKENDDKHKIQEQQVEYENPLLKHLYCHCRLVERVLDAWEENESDENKTNLSFNKRKGYMGHLTKIANTMVQHHNSTDNPCCKSLICVELSKLPSSTMSNWDRFVSSSLAETNAKNVIVPAHSYNARNHCSSSDDEETEFKELHFPQESALQQMQQMSEHFIDTFGFSGDDFNDDEDESGESNSKRFNPMNFGYDDDDEKSKENLFEVECRKKEMEEEDDETWSDKTKEIDFGMGGKKEEDKEEQTGSNSSEEDDKEKDMEVDEDLWSASKPSIPVAMDTGNPWESATSSKSSSTSGFPAASTSKVGTEFESDVADDDVGAAGISASSTPPEGGWADFGAFREEDTNKEVKEALAES